MSKRGLLKLKKLDEQGKKGAKHLSQRIIELLDSFEYYKEFFPDLVKPSGGGVQKRPIFQKKAVSDEVKELEFDYDVYAIEEDIHNQLATSQMFSTRDPIFIKMLGFNSAFKSERGDKYCIIIHKYNHFSHISF